MNIHAQLPDLATPMLFRSYAQIAAKQKRLSATEAYYKNKKTKNITNMYTDLHKRTFSAAEVWMDQGRQGSVQSSASPSMWPRRGPD